MALSDFLTNLKDAGKNIIASSKQSEEWYKNKITDVVKKDPSKLFKKYASPQVGKMYIYVYDPKHKNTLPFYDMFPLVIPVQPYPDGFLGINLHYLPPGARVQLLNALINIAGNDREEDTVKFNLSYDLLRKYANQFPGAKACVKRYLFEHVRSSFHYIEPTDWEKVVSMPLQKWSVNPDKKYAGSPPY
jgi:hypothetical protein